MGSETSSSTLIVTCADSNYFRLAQGCIHSINQANLGDQFTLAFLDVGCQAQQLDWVRENGASIVRPRKHNTLPANHKPHHLGLLARPFLREYFPGFSTYLWLDADAWVQDRLAIDMFVKGATDRQGMALVPEIDRGSMRQYGGLPETWAVTYRWYEEHFNQEVAKRIHSFPMLNAGVFAIHQDAPHWQVWADSIVTALKKRCTTMTDQLALNYSVYCGGLFAATEMLPHYCNWTCHNGFPTWDTANQAFIEPYLPHARIGIVHLTNRDKQSAFTIRDKSGRGLRMHVTYPPSVGD